MAISAETLNVILTARDKEFTKAMDRSQRRVERFASRSQRSLSRAGNSFNGLGRAAKRLVPLLGAAFSARAVTNMTRTASAIGKLASLSGTGVVEFQRFAAGARTVGIEMEKSADIIKDVSDKIGDFVATGGGSMADFFENIAPAVGVTAEQFMNLSGPQALGLYVDSLDKANLSQAEMIFYMEAIASDSAALLPLLRNNGSAMKILGDRAAQAGRILDEEAVGGARDLEEEMSDLSDTISKQLSTAILEHKDELKAVVDFITEKAIPAFSNLIGALERAGELYDLATGGGDGGPVAQLGQAVIDADAAALNALGDDSVSQTGTRYIDPETGEVMQFGVGADTPRIAGVTAPATPPSRPSVRRGGIDPDSSGRGSAIDSVEELTDRYRDLIGTLDQAVGLSNEYQDTVEFLDEAVASGAITQEEYNAGLDLAKKRFNEATFEASELSSIMQTVQSSMENAFMSMIDGTTSASDAFKSMATSVIKELYRVLVVQRLVNSITGAIQGFGLPAGGAPAVSLRPQARPAASGRPVTAGQPYIAGEHGRELFVPRVNGRILSAAQTNNMSKSGGETVTVIQNNSFGSGVSRAEVSAMLPRMVEATKAAVVDAKLRGGSYGRAFG